MVFNPFIWTTKRLLILGLVPTDKPVFDTWYHQPEVQGFTGAILIADLTKYLVFEPFGCLAWSSLLNCWSTSNLGISPNWPYWPVFDTQYHSKGVSGAILVAKLNKNLNFALDHLVALKGLQFLLSDCWPTSVISHWPYQPVFDIQCQPPRGHWGLFVANLTENLNFRPFGCSRLCSIASFGLLTNF